MCGPGPPLFGEIGPGEAVSDRQGAVGFARGVGVETPKVAILAAVETVRTKTPATLDGAILANLADRGQVVGGVVDGPLGL
jgi:phosphate acetyltransferase/phosphate butyryltransferase